MRLGVMTDEVTQDFKEALEFAKENGLDCVELRSAYEKGPFDYETEDILAIKKLSDEYGIPVVAISTPIFKCDYSEENIKLHTEKAAKIIEFAKILGATKLRCFDFFKNHNCNLLLSGMDLYYTLRYNNRKCGGNFLLLFIISADYAECNIFFADFP